MSSIEFTPSTAAAMITVGDVVTFEELYAQQYRPMVRLAYTLVDTQQRAEDVVQDAFAAIYERYDRVERPEAYLRVAVLNGCRRVLRRRMLRRAHPISPGQNGELVFNHVVDAIRRLPHRQRSMVVLRHDLQLSDVEVLEPPAPTTTTDEQPPATVPDSTEIVAALPSVPQTSMPSGDASFRSSEQLYTVVAGDSVAGIAQAFGMDMDVLVAYNEWSEGVAHPILPGDEIRIPPGAFVPGGPATEHPTTTATTTSTTVG